jgi:hypothetical protein
MKRLVVILSKVEREEELCDTSCASIWMRSHNRVAEKTGELR